MKAMFSFSFADKRRGAPDARPGRNRRFAAAIAEAALVEVARKLRRIMKEGSVDMTEGFQRKRNLANHGRRMGKGLGRFRIEEKCLFV